MVSDALLHTQYKHIYSLQSISTIYLTLTHQLHYINIKLYLLAQVGQYSLFIYKYKFILRNNKKVNLNIQVI